jgi:hypothetical protein
VGIGLGVAATVRVVGIGMESEWVISHLELLPCRESPQALP